MTGYTLIVSKEQQKHTRVCDVLKCFEELYRTAPVDAGGNHYPFFRDCMGCPDVSLCRPIRQATDEAMNNGL